MRQFIVALLVFFSHLLSASTIPELHDRALLLREQVLDRCEVGHGLSDTAEHDLKPLEAAFKTHPIAFKGLDTRHKALLARHLEIQELKKTITEYGLTLTKHLETMQTTAGFVCEQEGVIRTAKLEDRSALYKEVERKMKALDETSQIVDRLVHETELAKVQIARSVKDATSLLQNIDTFEVWIRDELVNPLAIVLKAFRNARVSLEEALLTLSSLVAIKEEASEISPHDVLTRQIRGFVRQISKKPGNLQSRLKKLEQRLDKLQLGYQSSLEALERLRTPLLEEGRLIEIETALEEAERTASLNSLVHEDIMTAHAKAKTCAKRAEREASPSVQVPDVMGKSLRDAKQQLEAVELRVNVMAGPSAPSEEASNTVSSQYPKPGGAAKTKDLVTIYLYSSYDTLRTVPSLIGQTVELASEVLQRGDLSIEVELGEPAPTRTLSHKIQYQTPFANDRVPMGAPVRVKVYTPFIPTRDVPNVTGLSAREAQSILAEANLQTRLAVGRPATSPEQEGRVQEQVPPAGRKLLRGQTVTIAVASAYKTGIVAPYLLGMTESEAARMLKASGLELRSLKGQPAKSRIDVGRAYNQMPLAGHDVSRRKLITVEFYGEYEGQDKGIKWGDGELYVVCRLYFPKLPRNLPSGMKMRDYMQHMTAGNTPLEPIDEVAFLRVSGDGWKAYNASLFQKGSRFSTSIDVVITEADTSHTFDLRGALLMEVIHTFNTYQAFKAAYPKKDLKKGASPLTFFRITNEKGTFNDSSKRAVASVNYSGGPLQKGWSEPMQQRNLDLFREAMKSLDCFIATAVYETPWHPDLDRLRSWRDRVLHKHALGITVSNLYYIYGPRAALWIKERPSIQKALKWVFRKACAKTPSPSEWKESTSEWLPPPSSENDMPQELGTAPSTSPLPRPSQ